MPYIGEIRMFAGNFAPVGWMFCEGQLLPISENDALFTLIGTIYGGDGQETFGLPNLASRVPIHAGAGGGASYQLGDPTGAESITLSVQQIPSHSHPLIAATGQAQLSPGAAFLGVPTGAQGLRPYNAAAAPTLTLSPASVGPAGSSQPHENMQPYLCVNFIISLFGQFPSQ